MPPPPTRATLLLADDHPQTAERLRALLQRHFDVVGLVADGRALVRAAAELSPDVIVADISMPIVDGIDAAKAILHEAPGSRIILVTMYTDMVLVDHGLAAGVLGYVLKDAAGSDLVPAVRTVLRGQRYLSPGLGGTTAT
jgi:DNA-binding NarL/FixJ family response regulator